MKIMTKIENYKISYEYIICYTYYVGYVTIILSSIPTNVLILVGLMCL